MQSGSRHSLCCKLWCIFTNFWEVWHFCNAQVVDSLIIWSCLLAKKIMALPNPCWIFLFCSKRKTGDEDMLDPGDWLKWRPGGWLIDWLVDTSSMAELIVLPMSCPLTHKMHTYTCTSYCTLLSLFHWRHGLWRVWSLLHATYSAALPVLCNELPVSNTQWVSWAVLVKHWQTERLIELVDILMLHW